MKSSEKQVPNSLRVWFVIHFAVDMLFAIPLLFFPEVILPLLGWDVVDPVMSRLVGAALLGIGGESLLGRKANREVFLAMLNLKILWASGAVLGIGLGIAAGAPPLAWGFLVIFAAFLGVWVYYRFKIQ
ncbi:MAG: hypothetical protein MUO54_13195 [Anaerolineales bacterium]|nr:hypothetical protein [Anaerolineales bacterium]